MAKTFFPHSFEEVEASPPHPENTKYKISIGTEVWNNANHQVVKIQMVYDGKIAGRRSPSYPINTDDYKRVMNKVEELLKNK